MRLGEEADQSNCLKPCLLDLMIQGLGTKVTKGARPSEVAT